MGIVTRVRKAAYLYVIVFFVFLFLYPLLAFSQTGNITPVNTGLMQPGANTANLLNPEKPVVKTENTKRDLFDVTLELLTSAHGQQTFDVIDENENLISRLKFPHRGQAMILKGELYMLPRLSLGGRWCSTSFLQLSNANSTDTDWKEATGDLVWQESNDSTKTEVSFSDINLYARVLKLEKGVGKNSRLSLDLFGGYQYQKSCYNMQDMTTTVSNYVPVSSKEEGHDSFYKIIYRGPRLGTRGEYAYNRFSVRLSFAYAWLKTNATALWNLRNYPFFQHGDGFDGYGVDLNAELIYQITKNISGGFGYNYMTRRQHKMRESGTDNTGNGPYSESDIIRNANSTLYGPSVFVRVNW